VNETCVYSNTEGTCDDGRECSTGDRCLDGQCVPLKEHCERCEKAWSCTEWSSCANGVQSRICSCKCNNKKCGGDSSTTRACEISQIPNRLNVTATEELLVGQVLQINVTDQDSNPVAAGIQLVRPDGSSIDLGTHTNVTYVVDQVGVWETRASKPDYVGDEADSSVTETLSIAEEVGKAVESVVSFLKENAVRVGLLLAFFFFLLFFLRRRRKKKYAVKKL
jgi:hypothetical protein